MYYCQQSRDNLLLCVCVSIAEFCREVTDIQMPIVAPVILPEMLKIFTDSEVKCTRTLAVTFA